jgi:hypothetical protein
MMRFIVAFILAASAILTMGIGIIHALPYDSGELDALLRPDTCAMPCWAGIRPGQSRVEELSRMLQENRWAADLKFNYSMQIDTGLLIWRWVNPPSALIERRRVGTAWIEKNIVQWIGIPTTLSFGDVWLFFDHPQMGATQLTSLIPPRINHYASYYQSAIQIRSTVFCPVRVQAFWESRVDVVIGARPLVDMNDYHLPAWLNCF